MIEGAAVRRALKGICPSAEEMRGALCNGDGALAIIKEEKKKGIVIVHRDTTFSTFYRIGASVNVGGFSRTPTT